MLSVWTVSYVVWGRKGTSDARQEERKNSQTLINQVLKFLFSATFTGFRMENE